MVAEIKFVSMLQMSYAIRQASDLLEKMNRSKSPPTVVKTKTFARCHDCCDKRHDFFRQEGSACLLSKTRSTRGRMQTESTGRPVAKYGSVTAVEQAAFLGVWDGRKTYRGGTRNLF